MLHFVKIFIDSYISLAAGEFDKNPCNKLRYINSIFELFNSYLCKQKNYLPKRSLNSNELLYVPK